ncbi:MAG: hypothetical protein KBT12_07600 [Bacteroidales bacterium]|nr:hypothetical protein [Candidatus Physcousia equi]
MTNEETQLIKLLETRVRQLILRNEELKGQNAQLWQQVAEDDIAMQGLREENAKLKADYDTLKMARMLSLNDNDKRNAKQRIQRLVKEVDSCIAILKAER